MLVLDWTVIKYWRTKNRKIHAVCESATWSKKRSCTRDLMWKCCVLFSYHKSETNYQPYTLVGFYHSCVSVGNKANLNDIMRKWIWTNDWHLPRSTSPTIVEHHFDELFQFSLYFLCTICFCLCLYHPRYISAKLVTYCFICKRCEILVRSSLANTSNYVK